jgi:hypothetical protein
MSHALTTGGGNGLGISSGNCHGNASTVGDRSSFPETIFDPNFSDLVLRGHTLRD